MKTVAVSDIYADLAAINANALFVGDTGKPFAGRLATFHSFIGEVLDSQRLVMQGSATPSGTTAGIELKDYEYPMCAGWRSQGKVIL